MRELYRPKYLTPQDWSVFDKDEADTMRRFLRAELLTEAVLAQFAGAEKAKGACLPWRKTWDNVRLREGEVSLWMGYNGHKKSMMLGQVAASLSSQGHRVCIASFEMAAHVTLARIVRQVLKGGDNPALIREVCKNVRIWFYDQHGDATPSQCYAMIRYCATLGIDHIIIDPMIKVIRGTDDYNAQKDFIAQLCALARLHEVHIHLVHHARKGSDESQAPRKLDARGAGEITDQVDNVFVCWWNKAKQDKRETGGTVEQTDPDALLICDKQRNGPWEGFLGLWFDQKSLQFCADRYYETDDLMGWKGPKSGRAALSIVEREPGEDEA